MSNYGIHKFFRTCLHDEAFRNLAKTDPEGAMAQMPISEEEKALLRAGDVKALYERGVHAFLLSFLTRWDLFGVTLEKYSASIQQAEDWRKAV
ncbi:MAG: hypothetical protein AB7F96_16850 [Beijerinckiaceae bacterium]